MSGLDIATARVLNATNFFHYLLTFHAFQWNSFTWDKSENLEASWLKGFYWKSSPVRVTRDNHSCISTAPAQNLGAFEEVH